MAANWRKKQLELARVIKDGVNSQSDDFIITSVLPCHRMSGPDDWYFDIQARRVGEERKFESKARISRHLSHYNCRSVYAILHRLIEKGYERLLAEEAA